MFTCIQHKLDIPRWIWKVIRILVFDIPRDTYTPILIATVVELHSAHLYVIVTSHDVVAC